MTDDRDAEDSRLLQAKDHARLLATYYPVIVDRCRVKLPDPDGWEVAHMVVDRLLHELAGGKTYSVPYRVVVHQVITWKIKEFFAGRSQDGPLGDWDAIAPDELEELIADHDLEAAFATLPPRDREVLRLRYLEALEPAEIAGRLDMKPNAVYQALHRGHKALEETVGG